MIVASPASCQAVVPTEATLQYSSRAAVILHSSNGFWEWLQLLQQLWQAGCVIIVLKDMHWVERDVLQWTRLRRATVQTE